MDHQPNIADRAMQVVSVALAFVLGGVCLAAGIAFALWQNPKIGTLASAVVADIFLTLGATGLVGALAACFPRAPVLRALADHMFRKLLILGMGLFVLLLILLIVL